MANIIREVAETLLEEMRFALDYIPRHGKFADDADLQSVLDVYREGIRTLEARTKDSTDAK